MWKSLQHRLYIARTLSWSDWLALAEAWWGLLKFSLALRRTSFEKLESSIRAEAKEATVPSGAAEQAVRLQQLVTYATHFHWLPMTCLVRTLALASMLARRGIEAIIRLGASRATDGIYAHAWLEVEGKAIGESTEVLERFKAFSSVKE